MKNSITHTELKSLIREVIMESLKEGTMGMSRRDLEKLDKIKKSSIDRRDFLKKAGLVGLGSAAGAFLFGLGRYSANKPEKKQSSPPQPTVPEPKKQVQQPEVPKEKPQQIKQQKPPEQQSPIPQKKSQINTPQPPPQDDGDVLPKLKNGYNITTPLQRREYVGGSFSHPGGSYKSVNITYSTKGPIYHKGNTYQFDSYGKKMVISDVGVEIESYP